MQCGNTEVCRNHNRIRRIRSGVFLEVSKSGNLHDLAEQTADIPCLDVAGIVVKTVSGKALQAIGIEQPELVVCPGIFGKCHAGSSLCQSKGSVGIVHDLIVQIVAQMILCHRDNVPMLGLGGFTAVHDHIGSGRYVVIAWGQKPAGLCIHQLEKGAVCVLSHTVKPPRCRQVTAKRLQGKCCTVRRSVFRQNLGIVLGGKVHQLRRIIRRYRRCRQNCPVPPKQRQYPGCQQNQRQEQRLPHTNPMFHFFIPP